MNHINRYGEINPKPARGPLPPYAESEDEFGMHREEVTEKTDWSHDPRSEAAHERHLGDGPHVVSLDDETLRLRVIKTLQEGMGTEPCEIKVEASEGVITLTGIVRNRLQKKKVQGLLEDFEAIRDLSNQLKIAISED